MLGDRYELVHGELLVSPAPRMRHQVVVGNLLMVLKPYVRKHDLGGVFLSPADVSWGGLPDVLVQPDVFVMAKHERVVEEWVDMRHFHLFVEVLSPTTARHDRFTKRRLYQEKQVPLYWLIDPESRRAEVWTPEATWPVIEERALTWQPAGANAPLVLELSALFEE